MGGLLMKDLKPVHVFKMVKRSGIYVGTETVAEYSHTIKANIQPAESKITAEVYGERVHNMFTVLCSAGAQICDKDKVSLAEDNQTAPTHKIVSAKRYSDHSVLLVEAIL